MNRIVFAFLVAIGLIACSKNKTYEYIEVVNKKSIFDEVTTEELEPEKIKALNDTLAYLKAFRTFTFSEKIHKDVAKIAGESFTEPIRFRLLSSDGIAINPDALGDLTLELTSIRTDVYSDDQVPVSNIDSAVIKRLISKFRIKKDEFDPRGLTWIYHKASPIYLNRNGVFCYFAVKENQPLTLRLRIQYHADDWLFFKKVQFSVDQVPFEFYPSSIETDHGSGNIWEWSDDELQGDDLKMIKDIAYAKNVKMKLIGRQYYKIKTLSNKQISAIKDALELFEAMGGST